MIHRLSDMIGFANCQSELPDGRWCRAVPSPWGDGLIGRARNAWAVVTGRAYAVRWPEAGELEAALAAGGRNLRPIRPPSLADYPGIPESIGWRA